MIGGCFVVAGFLWIIVFGVGGGFGDVVVFVVVTS